MERDLGGLSTPPPLGHPTWVVPPLCGARGFGSEPVPPAGPSPLFLPFSPPPPFLTAEERETCPPFSPFPLPSSQGKGGGYTHVSHTLRGVIIPLPRWGKMGVSEITTTTPRCLSCQYTSQECFRPVRHHCVVGRHPLTAPRGKQGIARRRIRWRFGGGGAASITAPHTTHHPLSSGSGIPLTGAEKRREKGARAFEKPTWGIGARGGASGCSENPRLRKRHHPPPSSAPTRTKRDR